MRGWKVWVEPSGRTHRCRWKGNYGTGQRTFFYKADAIELRDNKRRNWLRADAGLPPIRSEKAIMLSDWAAAYLSEKSKNPRQNTYKNFDKPIIERFAKFCRDVGPGEIEITYLSPNDCYAFKDWLYKQGYGDTSVRMHLAHLSAGFAYAVERKWMPENILENVSMPKSRKPGRVLTLGEIRTLYAAVPRIQRLAFVTFLNSGMRKGELIGLQKKQVDQSSMPWRVNFEAHQTKNHKPKTVILHRVAQKAIRTAMNLSKCDRVFERISEDSLDNWMKVISGLIGPVRLHDFKHTFCTYWMNSTGDIAGLQQMTGNSLNSLIGYIHLGRIAPQGLHRFNGFAPKGPLNGNARY